MKNFSLKTIISILVMSLVVFSQTNCLTANSENQAKIQQEKTYPNSSSSTTLNIKELKKLAPQTGNFNVEGYISKVFVCPPCPPGANCKPCMEENIVISKTKKEINAYELTDDDLIIFAKEPAQFLIGKKGIFSLMVRSSKTTNEPINDLELTGYTLE